jgi:hypothetical protein
MTLGVFFMIASPLDLTFGTPTASLLPSLLRPDATVNQQFLGPNYLVNGAAVDSNTLSLATLQNTLLNQTTASGLLNPLAGLSSLGLGTDLTQATLLNQLYQHNPHRFANEVPLAQIDLTRFKHLLAFQDRSETRQLGFQNLSQLRQLDFAKLDSTRDFDLQKQQLQLLSKKDDRGFWGNIIASVAPALLGFFAKNQEGSREERMFKWAHAQREKDDGDEKVKKRIAKLERLLKAKNDEDDDTCSTVHKKKKTKTCKHKPSNKKYIVTEDNKGDSSWVVVRKKKVDDDQTA